MTTRMRGWRGGLAAAAAAALGMTGMTGTSGMAGMDGMAGTMGAGTAGAAGAVAEAVIRDIAVVDIRRGVVLPARDVVIRGTVIAAMVPSGGALPPAKTVIDGRGKFAVPGLIDAHVTLARHSRESAAGLLAAGITAVRDIGTDATTIAEWRRALAFGKIYTPRVARSCAALRIAPAAGVSGSRTPSEPGCEALASADASPLAALGRCARPRPTRVTAPRPAGACTTRSSRSWRPVGSRGLRRCAPPRSTAPCCWRSTTLGRSRPARPATSSSRPPTRSWTCPTCAPSTPSCFAASR